VAAGCAERCQRRFSYDAKRPVVRAMPAPRVRPTISTTLAAGFVALALTAAPQATTAVASTTAPSTDTRPKIPMRSSLRVTKHGKDSKLVRFAVVVPTDAVFTAVCGARGGSCPATGVYIKTPGTELPDGTTKYVLEGTKRKPLMYPKGTVLDFMADDYSEHQPTTIHLTFTGPGKYRMTGNGA